ncbi:hypothetical protein FA13DRAFT_1896393 [Coprinellus micaceus]|uniref:CHAT domain-containing protein n=1 Tax=Coprinellus micaceus TaxID=71717 RepID=A0A4Y7SW40_COPMI|nr:hypothetical protein FA13DRAFT_1896393 [Coprinellus micaceus]
MAEQQSSPNSSDSGNEESVIGLKGMSEGLGFDHARAHVSVELLDVAFRDSERRGNSEHNDEITPGELRIFGLGGEDWKSFQLYEASPGEWKTSSPIELPPGVVGLRCIVEQDGRKDGRIIHLGCSSWKDDTSESDTGITKTGRISDAQLCLPMLWKSVEIATPKYPTHILEELARSKMLRGEFKRTGNLANISEAISIRRRIVEVTPEDDANLAAMLNNLAMSFLDRFEHTGDLGDLADATSLQTRAVDLTPAGHEDLPSRLYNLGNSLQHHFKRTGELSDIARAISVQMQAVDLAPEGHVDRPAAFNNLGNSYQICFERTGHLPDIENAISALTNAVHLTPEGDANLPSMLNNLGNSFLHRFERLGNLADAAEAISLQIQAVHLTPKGHADLPTWLMNLGGSFQSRFEQMGNLGDVAESISLQTHAVHLTPEGHTALPSRLVNLGNSFLCRFEQTGNLGDIAGSISLQTHAVHLTPEGHAALPSQLMNLANSFVSRFEVTKDASDLSEAIPLQTRAVDLTPAFHANLPSWLNNLGISFLKRFQCLGNMGDIAEAIARQNHAVDLTPKGHADLSILRTNLGNSYIVLFGCTNNPADGKDGISNLVRALQLTPEMHAELPPRYMNLASAWFQYFTSSHRSDHLDASISNYKSAATCTSGSPRTRLAGAICWAKLLNAFYPRSTSVLTAFGAALDLVTSIAGLEQTVQHRYTMVGEFLNIPMQAAAAAFRHDCPNTALEWLERGRCMVWGQQSQLRAPLDALHAQDPALADRIAFVSGHLENAGSSRQHSGTEKSWDGKVLLEDEALKQSHLASEWDFLLTRVRDIPGFESFLQPLRCSTILRHLPESGPVVVWSYLFCHLYSTQCDAIVLLAGLYDPLHVKLPDFSLAKARQYRHDLNTQLCSHHPHARQPETIVTEYWKTCEGAAGRYGRKPGAGTSGIHLVLRNLWNEVVKPILDVLSLRLDDSSQVPLTRIWWCPTGPLSFLPLHAAGVYEGPHWESIMDYAVSSYTPTVTSLTQRVSNRFSIREDVSGLFLVAQPEVPHAAPIPGTTKEVGSIHDMAVRNGIRSMRLDRENASATSCPDFMEQFSSIHLACHASQNASNPLQSRFLFHDGHLTLNTIMQKNLKNTDLAFLSACETSTGEETLADEAVHLAAGMLAAGYRRVVATMWSISDLHAPEVANDFYEFLWAHRDKDSGTGFDGTLSAYALHHAIRNLQENLDNTELSLLTWIPYVHFGY